MASNGGEGNTGFLSSSRYEEQHYPPVFNNLASPRSKTSESSEKSDNGWSDVEEDVPREVELSEQYGRTPPSSRTFTKPSKGPGRTKSTRRKKDKSTQQCRRSPSSDFLRRRQSATVTASERAFNRSIKEEESSGSVLVTNGFDEMRFRPRNRSMTESSLSRKPSQRKFQCIKYREFSVNAVHSSNFKDKKNAVCPPERVKFYETMNMLINLGQGGNAEGKESIVEETENYEVEELREALWLELQAWRNSTTMLNQDEYLMNQRKRIDAILDDVIFFHVDKTQQVNFDILLSDTDDDSDYDDSDKDGCCELHPFYSFFDHRSSIDSETNDLVYYDDSKLSTSSDISGTTFSTDEDTDTVKLSEFAQTIKTAVKHVSSTLDKLYLVEQLYPSRGALSKDFAKYNSKEFQDKCDTLVLWLNQIKGLYHKLHVMSRLVRVDFDDEKVWKDWIDLGIELNCVKSYNSCQNCQDRSACDFEMPENFEGLKRGLSSENTSTSRYRPFVDQNIKKMGVASLGYKLHQIIHVELARASQVLTVDRSTSVFLKHQMLHLLYKKMLMHKIENFKPNMNPEDKEAYVQTYGVPTENWVERFQKMGLPSFDRLYLFLVHLVVDIYHECLRMRMEHRPKGEPSSLSVRQLLEECKEVLLAAVVMRQYFLDALEGLGTDLNSCPQFEEQVLEFDQDIQKMLEVYFEYLHLYMHMLQRLPEASCGVKNILEDEWEFVKEITPYIRGGEVQSGKRFCVMARGLVESTADFLTTGMDEFSGLHDVDDNEKHWLKVLQSCRDFKKLFKETRERSIKAVGFVKRLRTDLGVAATFHVNVPYAELLEKLKSSGYIQVVTKLSITVLMFVKHSLKESKRCIIELLNACCGLHSQSGACAKGMDNYIVLVSEKNTDGCEWTGEQIDVTPTLDASLGLLDIQVDELSIVACTSCVLSIHITTFKAHMVDSVTCSSGSTSCHHDLIDMKKQISESLVNLRTKVCDALDGAVENLDVEKMYGIEENERCRLNRSTLEALQFAFNAVFDFHREMRKIPEADETSLSIVGKYYLELASKWMEFVLKRCEKGKGSRPRWAGQGLKFLIEACHPTISCHLSNEDFETLQHQINKCVAHVVGSADNLMNSNSPNSSSAWSPNSKFSRSSTFPGTHSHVHPSRTISEPGRTIMKRSNTLEHDRGEDLVDNEVEAPQRRISCVREAVAELEYARQSALLDKGVIGKVSNKKRDLAGELAVIPKRVPFKWQRGNKIGEGQFGKVYACVNLDTEEVVAMKQITFHPNDHSSFQDLADEIKAFEGLAHCSLVKYYGCEVHRDVMYIFMEYCGDGTISDVSKLGLPEAMIRKYTDQILIAVEFLHDRGIVHRDIKGPNIFLSSEGLIKLGDFGASIKLVNPSQTMCGEVSTLRGTIAYMAPEVITLDRGSGYGRAADIWSVGCVVVEMATGKPPWSDYDNQLAIMFIVGEGGSPAIPDILSDEGKDFLMNCFVLDPHERWTARQLQNHTFLKI